MQVPMGSTFSTATLVNAVKTNVEVVQTSKPNQKRQTQAGIQAMETASAGTSAQRHANQERGSIVDMFV